MAVTAWVKPALEIKGQDHLAVRAPCENLYTQLLPGVTNVTDRARLYSFYPWFIWAFEKHKGPLSKKPLLYALRRAECLLTLIGAWHENVTEEAVWKHGGGLVGRETLLPALRELEEENSLKLSLYATLDDDSSHRYFKNKYGGLGQYYLSTLRDLGIVGGDSRSGIRYTRQRGAPLAEAFDSKVDREGFFEGLEQDRISIEVLRKLRRFCPCYLKANKSEHAALTDLFFNRPGTYNEAYGENRRKTLALILDLAAKLESSTHAAATHGFDVRLFRAAAYTGALADGTMWVVPQFLEDVRQGWQLYQRNELLSIAVQSVFWAGLAELRNQGLILENSESYGNWFAATFTGSRLKIDVGEHFESIVERARQSLPSPNNWTDSRHEIQLGWRLADIKNNFTPKERHSGVVKTAFELLVALAARGSSTDNSYSGYVQSRGYLLSYPINLDSFNYHVRNTWQGFTVSELLRWLATEWGVTTHFRVALRKLHYETRDTFRIKPTEQGLTVIDSPVPVFSNPRLSQAIQILWDLAAVDWDDELETWVVTDLGHALLKECQHE